MKISPAVPNRKLMKYILDSPFFTTVSVVWVSPALAIFFQVIKPAVSIVVVFETVFASSDHDTSSHVGVAFVE